MKRPISLSFLLLLMACAEGHSPAGPPPHNPDAGTDAGLPDEVTARDEGVGIRITMEPFGFAVFGPEGDVLTGANAAEASIALLEREVSLKPPVLEGFDGFDRSERTDVSRLRGLDARLVAYDDVSAEIALTDPNAPGEEIRFLATADGGMVRINVTRHQSVTDTHRTAAEISFAATPDENFVGLGERESAINHRGKRLYNWTEEGGIGLGEDVPSGPTNPFPNGEGMTHLPVPFFLSSAGYGLWLDTTYRSQFDFDSADEGRLHINADEPRLGITIAVSPDPKEVLRIFTRETGRTTLPAPWVFGPRKRVNPGDMVGDVREIEALRARGVAMTAVDDTTHVLPHGSHLGREAELAAWTADLHRLGYKAIAYLNPHISTERAGGAAYLAHARDHNALVLRADGSEVLTKIISGGLQEVATIDFSSGAGRHFFEEVMGETLALGYDGWMLDFGEYLPHDAVLADGRTGSEAHNDFPLLVQRTTRDYLDTVRPGDYLFFVRSGYTGTQAIAPMVWSGDPSVSFADSRGLPAQVRSGISAGLSGIPYWGSDGTGFTCLATMPEDKENFLRWMAFAALSPDMHEQDACAQRPEGARKWTMWDDEETTAAYAKFSGLHTRLFPYIYAAAHEATVSGLPIMRHALLMHPDVPAAWEPQTEYYFGPALYVAPIVTRGATERNLWLPPGDWFDWYTLEHATGDRHVTRAAPMNEIPLWLRAGEIVPMLDSDVMTLAVTDAPDVVDMSDRSEVLDVRIALTENAPNAGIRLVDGTLILAHRPGQGVSIPADFDAAANESDLRDCSRCARTDTLPDGTVRLRATFTDGMVAFGNVSFGAIRDHGTVRVRYDVLIR